MYLLAYYAHSWLCWIAERRYITLKRFEYLKPLAKCRLKDNVYGRHAKYGW